MNKFELDFYSRQITLPNFGLEGQEKLKRSKVLIAGVGGLGSPALQYLSAAGVGEIGLCDFDELDVTNLHRQTIFDFDQAGQLKVEAAKKQIGKFNPHVKINTISEKINVENVETIIRDFDVVLDCTDNFTTKFLIHDACYLNRVNLVQASIYQYEGQLQVFRFSNDTHSGCYRCLWHEIPDENCIGVCADVGVLGTVPGVFGTLQAMETVKLILGWQGLGRNETFIFDLLSLDSRKIKWKKKADCPLCGDHPRIKSLLKDEYDKIEEYELHDNSVDLNNYVLVDIREEVEKKEKLAFGNGIQNIPYSSFDHFIPELKTNVMYLFFCDHGVTSKKLVKELRDKGILNTFSLKEGVKGIKRFLRDK